VGDADEMMLIKVGMLTTKSSSGKMLIGDNISYPVREVCELLLGLPWRRLEPGGRSVGIGSPVCWRVPGDL
jgi:hypothetical protein